ncbi:S-layer homology domain-containing protein [Phascolarctobacterium succinatutens]|uniref:S-layer homology domain-containing protein n=1 Tax=Phascolarctobacterium succinatutens TaxID=626940 RepID=UPI00265FD2E5|nr:S-layer homology domain-containing protein [Phascolarctobacterium succinatutens]
MKKSLVLAMAMALGVTASAYAANPFSDVPAGHWAYDSISKLAAAGVIDGYGDGTFGGDKLMTRYEMAQIVAKAMAKGASVERLAAEFADELDNLGVRVANLEKKADNVKVTGEVRFRYVNQDGAMARFKGENDNLDSVVLGNKSNHVADIRSRIWINGMINDDWIYTGMLQNVQNLNNNTGDENTSFQRAYVDGKLGGMAVRAGRYNLVIADGNIYDTRADGLELSYGNKLKLKGFAGKATDDITVVPFMINDGINTETGDITNGGKYWGLAVEGELAKGLKATAGYTQFKDMGTGSVAFYNGNFDKTDIDNGIWHAGLSYDMGHFNLSAMYLKGDLSADKLNDRSDGNINKAIDKYLDDDGFVIGLSYKGAKAEDAGSWGAWAKYYDQGAQTYVAHTTDANTFGMTGFKGFGVGANYTLAKNIVANVAYYNTESKLLKELPSIAADFDRTKDHRFWTDVTFTF